jgi:hypothetical protein
LFLLRDGLLAGPYSSPARSAATLGLIASGETWLTGLLLIAPDLAGATSITGAEHSLFYNVGLCSS